MTEEQALAEINLVYLNATKGSFNNAEPGCDKSHIRAILQDIVDGNVTGAKAHRFIGWAQGVMCMVGVLPLGIARSINKKAIEEMK